MCLVSIIFSIHWLDGFLKSIKFALLKSPVTTCQLWIWRQALVTDEACYIMIALEFTFNTFSNGWKRKKEIQNMLTYIYSFYSTRLHAIFIVKNALNLKEMCMIFSSFVKGLSRKWINKNLPPLFGRCISFLFYSDLLKTILQSLQQCIVCLWKRHLAYMHLPDVATVECFIDLQFIWKMKGKTEDCFHQEYFPRLHHIVKTN
jgi:hypothetical protein